MTTIQNKTQKTIPTYSSRHNGFSSWFTMTENDIQEKFLSLKGAKKVGKGQKSFVYVPGTRSDRVLLVAHSDTVWSDEKMPSKIAYYSDMWFSTDRDIGVGADDRAGCAILWKLKDLGHSLLIPAAEESGCIGSKFLMKMPNWADEIAQHQFAIQFDRMNADDLVFYDNASEDFKKWCTRNIRGYTENMGFWTDICYLCDKISGVNISIGYYNQHDSEEVLVQSEWNRTLDIVTNLLKRKRLPRFVLTEQDKKPSWMRCAWDYSGDHSHYSLPVSNTPYNKNTDDDEEDYQKWLFKNRQNKNSNSIISCPFCHTLMDYYELDNNDYVCPKCEALII